MIRSIVKVSFLLPFLWVRAQTVPAEFVQSAFLSDFPDTVTIRLIKPFIDDRSIVVTVDSTPVLLFTYEGSTRSLQFRKQPEWSDSARITVVYSYQRFDLQPVYRLRTPSIALDSGGLPKSTTIFQTSDGLFGNSFGPELSKSGSITRGFLVGSNRDLTLSSGFRLQMSGKLSDNIDIVAALTDENTPIQPQGNTQTLQEVDNVFVQINGPVYSATLGDFLFDVNGGEFSSLHRKVQGARVIADYTNDMPRTSVQVTGASSRGKFHSVQFSGVEGMQGPYRLTGKNNERAIVVIAGSERVYVDGDRMTRGDNNDYSIEYGSAEVTFSSKRLITAASRITIDFEYADRQFTRNFFGIGAHSQLSASAAVRIDYFRESDDPDAPIDISLTDEDRNILRSAGNSLPVRSGVVFVGTDTLGIGKGSYAAVDTVISGDTLRVYRFEQFTPLALYAVAFSAAPDGKGDYRREAPGLFRFVGIGAGEYLPQVLIPVPQQQQLVSLRTTVSPFRTFTLDGEFAASNADPNRLSELGDNKNPGTEYNVSALYAPTNLELNGMPIGALDLQFSQRAKDHRFTTFDRSDEVEFGRKWSTDSLVASFTADELLREGHLVYKPRSDLTVTSGVGTMDRSGQFSSRRYDGAVEWSAVDNPYLRYSFEKINGEESQLSLSNEWFRQRGDVRHTIGAWTPAFRFEQEERRVYTTTTDSLRGSSYSFRSAAPNFQVRRFFGMDIRAELELRENFAGFSGRWEKQSRSVTYTSGIDFPEVNHYSGSVSVSLRELIVEPLFQQNNSTNVTTLVKATSRYRPFSHGMDIDLFYDVSTQRTAQLERYFFKVRKGEGQFVWTDANGDGNVDLFDEREFRPDRYEGEYIALTRSSDFLVPVVNLKTTGRVRVVPRRFLSRPETVWEKILVALSSESYVRIEERSTERRTEKIYTLDPAVLLNPRTTQAGSQLVQQDLFLFENDPGRSFRFRFSQRRSLGQFTGGREQNYARERSVRSRIQLTSDIADQTEIVFRDDNAVSTSVINRSRLIVSALLRNDLSYRPATNNEMGLVLETSQAEDGVPIHPARANFNGQTVRYVYGFAGTGQVRIDFSREEVIVAAPATGYVPPFELTGGRDIGKNYLWTLSSEYRVQGNIQFSLAYSGRTTPNSGVVHTGRMEVRAYF